MAEYIISEKAQADLSDIWNYTVETWSENQADRYMRLLFGELDKITLDSYHVGQSYEYVRRGYRGLRAGKHGFRRGLWCLVRCLFSGCLKKHPEEIAGCFLEMADNQPFVAYHSPLDPSDLFVGKQAEDR